MGKGKKLKTKEKNYRNFKDKKYVGKRGLLLNFAASGSQVPPTIFEEPSFDGGEGGGSTSACARGERLSRERLDGEIPILESTLPFSLLMLLFLARIRRKQARIVIASSQAN